MKKTVLLGLAALIGATGLSAEGAKIKKQGFLTSEYCIKRGYFTDCRLDSYDAASRGVDLGDKAAEKAQLVLYVHNDLQYYKLDVKNLSRHDIDEGFARNGVMITGTYDAGSNMIKADTYKGPPPPAKSFFKGCL